MRRQRTFGTAGARTAGNSIRLADPNRLCPVRPPRLRSAPALAGRAAFSHRLPLRIQVLPDLDVASVYIRAKLQPAIDIRECSLVHHEYRHGLWQIASGGAARRDRLIDCVDRLL